MEWSAIQPQPNVRLQQDRIINSDISSAQIKSLLELEIRSNNYFARGLLQQNNVCTTHELDMLLHFGAEETVMLFARFFTKERFVKSKQFFLIQRFYRFFLIFYSVQACLPTSWKHGPFSIAWKRFRKKTFSLHIDCEGKGKQRSMWRNNRALKDNPQPRQVLIFE